MGILAHKNPPNRPSFNKSFVFIFLVLKLGLFLLALINPHSCSLDVKVFTGNMACASQRLWESKEAQTRYAFLDAANRARACSNGPRKNRD